MKTAHLPLAQIKIERHEVPFVTLLQFINILLKIEITPFTLPKKNLAEIDEALFTSKYGYLSYL